MSRQKMTDVLYDLQIAQALYQQRYNEYASAEKKEALIKSVFEKHEITQAILDTSLVWYSDHVDDYMRINDSVIARLRRQQIVFEKLDERNSSTRAVNYNILPSYVILDSNSPILSFSIDSFKMKEIDLPNFALSFDLLGYGERDNLAAALIYEYVDTVVYINKYVSSSSRFEIKYHQPLDRRLKNISGYVKLTSKVKNNGILLNNLRLLPDKINEMSNENLSDSIQSAK